MLVPGGAPRPDNDMYALEVKWDGFRALFEADPRDFKIMGTESR